MKGIPAASTPRWPWLQTMTFLMLPKVYWFTLLVKLMYQLSASNCHQYIKEDRSLWRPNQRNMQSQCWLRLFDLPDFYHLLIWFVLRPSISYFGHLSLQVTVAPSTLCTFTHHFVQWYFHNWEVDNGSIHFMYFNTTHCTVAFSHLRGYCRNSAWHKPERFEK